MNVPVTLLYGGLCALLLTLLSLNVTLSRIRLKTKVGDTPSEMIRSVRAHGNAMENIPIALILLLALELAGVGSFRLHLFGGAFVVARSLHAIGLITKIPVSVIGMTLSHICIIGMGVLALVIHFGH